MKFHQKLLCLFSNLMTENNMLGVYVHIPFCESKCAYCAFSSFVTNEEEKEKYIDKLVADVCNFSEQEKVEIDTIYIGGGTPSVLSVRLIQKLFDALKEKFNLKPNYEFTVEANPCSLTEEKLRCYKENGVNRLSLGVQSLDDDKLRFIGRRHSSQQAIDAIKLAKKYIDNISCDLLIGLKGMEKEEFLAQAEQLAGLGIKHISAYMLQVEEGTPLAKMIEADENLLPEDEKCVDVYDALADKLQTLGFERYEVSNFALPGFESRHNFKYWIGEQYIGFGLGAHSYLNGIRTANSSNFEDFYRGTLSGREELRETQKLEEHIMLGLRCRAGISKIVMKSFGYDILQCEDYHYFKEKGVLVEKGDIITLNPQYYGVSNYVIVKLLP